MNRKQSVLGITAVERTPHTAHQGNNLLTDFQSAVGRIDDLSGTLDSGNDRLIDIIVLDLKLSEYLLAVIQSERFDFHKHPA